MTVGGVGGSGKQAVLRQCQAIGGTALTGVLPARAPLPWQAYMLACYLSRPLLGMTSEKAHRARYVLYIPPAERSASQVRARCPPPPVPTPFRETKRRLLY